ARSAGSPAHACSRYAARSSGLWASAWWKISSSFMPHLGSGPCSLPFSYARNGAGGTKILPEDWKGDSGFGAEAEFAAQPGPGVAPPRVRAAGTNPQRCGCLGARQPGEVAQFDEPGLERILFRQTEQRRVEGEQVHVRLRCDKGFRIQVQALPTAAVLVRM